MERAVLIVVPNPEEHEFGGAEEAMLRRVSELAEGASEVANTALLVNSARAARLIAQELCAMGE